MLYSPMDLQVARAALQKYFGYDTFRPMQGEVINAIYQKQDALVLMPTGGGKSICYQIPAVTLDGACVVVSPLISLMKDQVEGLLSVGIQAAYLNSTQELSEQRRVEDRFIDGEIDLLYVSPEKLVSQGFFELMRRGKVSLFAIDEAHCISAWGHDFRPEYTQLRFLKQSFPGTPIIALTATADKVTRRDIIDQLQLADPAVFIASFDRPNISLEVRPGQKRFEQILRFIQERPNQPGIIYCLSRKSTEDLAAKLRGRGVNAGHYHARMEDGARAAAQEDFINDNLQVVCATVAFGMGIDKSNVRWIIHYNLPKNLESYYQEIGRAGRDGAKAETLLFYSYNDLLILRDILTKSENAEQTEVQLTKLERMRQYAESPACRRRILLNYFSETLEENCGNCDVCHNPPEHFDGTVVAQKALSAVYRLREKVGMTLLIDVLRGSGKKEILQRGYDKIKTYGAGRHHSQGEWQYFMQQLLNLGYIDIDHEHFNVVRLTPASQKVLFEGEKVELVKLTTAKQLREAAKAKAKPASERQRVRDDLFEQLRQLRKQLAQQRGVPPYIIFNDATLEEMAAERPTDDAAFRRISGVGERKLQQYGDAFMQIIREFNTEHTAAGEGAAQQPTLELFHQGLTIDQIAERRSLDRTTVYAHLALLYERGEAVPLQQFIRKEELRTVLDALRYLEQPYRMKSIHEYLDGRLGYDKIRLAMAYYNRHQAG